MRTIAIVISRLARSMGLIGIIVGYSSNVSAIPIIDIIVAPTTLSGLVEGSALTNGTVATFSTDVSDFPGNFIATIHWGDGSTSAGTISGSGTSFSVTGSHTYADEGAYTYYTDITWIPSGFLAIGPNDLTNVADAPLSLISTTSPISFTPGVPLTSLTLATFSDANPLGSVADFIGSINWGDGNVSAGTIVSGSPSEFSLVGFHTYVSGGNFPILLNISDIGGSSIRAVSVASNTIPEPATFVLFISGLSGIVIANRHNKSELKIS